MKKIKTSLFYSFAIFTGLAVLLSLSMFYVIFVCDLSVKIKTLVCIVSLFITGLLIYWLSTRITSKISNAVNKISLEQSDIKPEFIEFEPLISKISKRNTEISKQIKEISVEHEKQDAMRRDFTANVSHELKTPLTTISGYAEIIKNGIARPDDIERFAEKIYNESQRLVMLVGDIIKLSQLDSKEIPVKIEQIDLYDLCSAIISQLEMSINEKNIKVNLIGEHIVISAAEQIVYEMIFNICDNAVKYNSINGEILIELKHCVDGAELSISDKGIGIPSDEVERVFERFYRVDKSHSKEIGGTGLGLSIVKHGARFLGAEVSIQSELGKGTTVRLNFK